MKKKELFRISLALSLVLIMLSAAFLAACAQAPAPSPAPAPAPKPATTQPAPTATKPAETIEMRVNSHWPSGGIFVEKVFTPPLEAIKQKGNGLITYKMFASGALGGGTEQYENAKIGKFDVAADITTLYTPGRFPLSDVLSLPVYFNLKASTDTVPVTMAVFDRILSKEYEDTKTFGLYIVPNFSPIGNKKITKLEDWKGLKVRTLGGVITKAILALGAEPIQMPIPDMYLALQTGVVDVGIMNHSAVPQFKFHEVSKYFMQGFSIGNTVNAITMNKATWQKIPDNLKPMVEQELRNAGFLMNKSNDDTMEPNFNMFKKAGVEMYSPSKEEFDRWNKVLVAMVESWVKEVEAKGQPAGQALKIYKEECEKAKIPFPF